MLSSALTVSLVAIKLMAIRIVKILHRLSRAINRRCKGSKGNRVKYTDLLISLLRSLYIDSRYYEYLCLTYLLK